MILQGKTPRALTVTGLLAVAGVGLLVLPLVFSRSQDVQVSAQQPPKEPEPHSTRTRCAASISRAICSSACCSAITSNRVASTTWVSWAWR